MRVQFSSLSCVGLVCVRLSCVSLASVFLALVFIFSVGNASVALADGPKFQKSFKAKPLDDKGAIVAAGQAVKNLRHQGLPVEGLVLEADWEQIGDSEKKLNKKGPGYFIVSINNVSLKKKLYVLLSETGDLYDANYNGQFKGVEKAAD